MVVRLLGTAICLFLAATASFSSPATVWENTVTAGPPGPFPPPRPFNAHYRFAWSGFTAALAEVDFTKPSHDRFQLEGVGHTTGLVRALWKMDVTHHAESDANRLRPLRVEQLENVRSKKILTRLDFTGAGVTRLRTESKEGKAAPKPKQFNFPNLFDLHTSLLYLRSQTLRPGSVHRIVVYPATSAYLATITVRARERISVPAGTFNAIKLDLQLKKVGKNGELEPHRKFRRATAWISDDADRMVLRIEAQIFVGTVFAELQSVQFDGAKT